MNKNMQRLMEIAAKETKMYIGLMSGTSLDGLDIALCAIRNHGRDTKVELLHFKTVPYSSIIKDEIRKVFAKSTISFQHLCLLNPWIGKIHASFILDALREWNVQPHDVDIIASHGQTVYHSPMILHGLPDFPNATLQIGDGDHIAVDTGIITLSDFRQKHIAAGGEGAPLALYGDYCVFSKKGENRILLNMGGIANFTFISGNYELPEVMVTDTGPGNTLIDALAQKLFKVDFDKDAAIASSGNVNADLLAQLKANDFFAKPFPKTTGPELFNLSFIEDAQVISGTTGISNEDLLATITRLSADTIAEAIMSLTKKGEEYTIYMSGGGAHNPLLIKWISESLPGISMRHTGELGIPGDAKEAILFAVLANEAIAGEPIDWPIHYGMPSVTMGKISFPW
jgi:anhydro-N-acetylmuramic acid kinase